MRKTYIFAALIAIAIGVWLFSGQLDKGDPVRHATLADQKEKSQAAEEDRIPTKVRARISQAESYTATVVVRGRTENKRNVDVRAETQGRVEARPVEKGSRVAAGDLLCKLAVEDRNANLAEAREGFNQARIDYDGAQRLKQKGFQAETDIARARARLASAQASVERAKLAIDRIYLRAPFAGIVEDTQAEVGDYLQPGATCATVIDLDPMLLVGRVSERDVDQLELGGPAKGLLTSGQALSGEITFVGRQSDASTRTYAIEVAIPNADYSVRSGLTAQISVPVGKVQAHLISPALLALDTQGNIGLRTLSEEDQVVWNDITIINDSGSGAWVTGLPDVVRLITVGQEMVVPGERVEAVFEVGPNMPASRPRQNTDESATSGKTKPATTRKPETNNGPEISPAPRGPAIANNNVVAAS